MGSGYQHDFTENLEAVARGVRRLEDIADPELRDAVGSALGMGAGGARMDAARRARIRRIVLAAAPRQARPSDRAVGVLTLVASPAPHAVRLLAVLVLCAGLLAGATVAGADSLPDEPLYGVKVAAEQLRLALAAAPEDRAAVELSLAEHRLHEAERLAARGSESGALIAAGAYAAHLASAAAELSQVVAPAPRALALLTQLESRLAQQRSRAGAVAERLLADPRTALAGAVLGTIATTPPGAGATAAGRIAERAAAVSARISEVADDRARLPVSGAAGEDADAQEADEEEEEGEVVPPSAPGPTAAARAAAARTPAPSRAPAATAAAVAAAPREARTETRRPTAAAPTTAIAVAPAKPAATARATAKPTVKPTARPTVDPSARIAAEKAREAAAKAKLAAERAKTTPTPKPARTPARR